MLDTTTWKPFPMYKIFDIKKGKRLTKEDQIPGDTPFIGATTKNNGITSYIGQDPIFEGNVITLTYNGSIGEAFYQQIPFWASDDVNVLYPKDFILNEKIAMFLCTILRHEKQMWSYARKWTVDQMNNTLIKLPVNENGNPDFHYMESFINDFDSDIHSIPDYFLTEGYEKTCWYLDNIKQDLFEDEYAECFSDNKLQLSDRQWKMFFIEKDLNMSIYNGKSYNASDLTEAIDDNYCLYVTRTDDNNGVSMYVQADDYEGLEQENAITIGDTTANIHFQDHAFITGPHIIILRADWLNVYTASFIITLLNQEKYRYPVFGRAFTKDLIKKTQLYLPADENGKPDFLFMENFIKSIPFSNHLK